MNLNTKSPNEVAVASQLLVTRLGELLIRKGIISRIEAALVVAEASKEATSAPGWITGTKAMPIIEEVGQFWSQVASDAD